MPRLLIATRNAHKTAEIAAILGDHFTVEDLSAHPDLPEVEETGTTFEENAALKAVAISQQFPDRLFMADDSGLETDALGGAPGVRSARYSGEGATDEKNLQLLLENLRGKSDRTARFRCVIVIARGGKVLASFSGSCEGRIVDAPRGTDGFGYDPIFVPEGESRSFAELTAGEKNTMSHRARAMAQAVAWFAAQPSA